MVFKCQEDSYLKEFTSKVVSCGKSPDNSGKYEIILEDTILFPEGGGQPTDHGYLNDIPVKNVIRKGDKAIHLTDHPLEVGEIVKERIDWKRRFDHMQQHSGQHLISAIFEDEFRYPTVSWWLGEEVSHIELGTSSLSQEEIRHVEERVNELIRLGKKVTVNVFTKDSSVEDLNKGKTRGLPADHVGDIRVINIEDVDYNMCCGTHVTNLCQLQVIKLLHSERSKRKTNTLLYFLVGNRVMSRLQTCLEREQKLTKLLNGNPAEHADLVEKHIKTAKALNKNVQRLLKEVAILEAQKLKKAEMEPKYFILHRKDAEPNFMDVFVNVFIQEFKETKFFLFLSTDDGKSGGNILLYGDEKNVAELGNSVCEILEGKGVSTGKRFQAKISKMKNYNKATALFQDYISKM